MIRPFHQEDAAYLAPIHTTVFPHNPLSTAAFSKHVASMRAAGARAWTITLDAPIGYALAIPVPGLPHIADLSGCIAPGYQHQGFGSLLLSKVIASLRPSAIRQLSYATSDLQSAGARFLQKKGFTLEHEEWLLIRPELLTLPSPGHKRQAKIMTYARASAVARFLDLFAASFGDKPWNQPYSKREVGRSLGSPKDMLFLSVDSQPIGFAWLHLEAAGLGVIEPLGILPAYQNQGYGRFLLLSALHELAQRGAARAQIGAWRSNEPAIHLYRSLGFIHQQTISFLAYDLAPQDDC